MILLQMQKLVLLYSNIHSITPVYESTNRCVQMYLSLLTVRESATWHKNSPVDSVDNKRMLTLKLRSSAPRHSNNILCYGR